MILSRLDELPRGAWIALVVLGFWFWWPAGVATLGYLAFARRRGNGAGTWYNTAPNGEPGMAGPFGQGSGGPFAGWGFGRGGRCGSRAQATSGNKAFDDYRADTLRRLEEEQREFVDYLERLRQARDKSEFDSYMAERRGRQAPTPPAEPSAAA